MNIIVILQKLKSQNQIYVIKNEMFVKKKPISLQKYLLFLLEFYFKPKRFEVSWTWDGKRNF